MKKVISIILLVMLCGVMLMGCGEKNTDSTANGMTPIPTPESVNGDNTVPITSELRKEYFDLAREMRWDFLPVFEAGQAPKTAEDYIYLVAAQQLQWEDYFNIKQDSVPTALTAEYVNDYVQTHFGVDLEQPQAGSLVGHFRFDGKQYIVPAESWKELPMFELESVSVDDENGKKVYTVQMNEYICGGEALPEMEEIEAAEQAVLSGLAAEQGLKLRHSLQVCYSVNEQTGDLIYEAVYQSSNKN